VETAERRKIIELMLWLTDRPLPLDDFKDVLGEDYPGENAVREDIEEFGKSLDAREAALQVTEVAGGWQVSSRTAFSGWVRKLFKERTTLRLSSSALETLSIVAYKQPITRGEIEEIRGVEVSAVLETLLERKLIKIIGRKESLGRPLLYGTTLDFMRQFGLKSLEELPKLDELIPPEEAAAAASQAPADTTIQT
jgi:segregation and condensation protein B